MNLVIEIENSQIKASFFQNGKMSEHFTGTNQPFREFIKGKKPDRTLATSLGSQMESEVLRELEAEGIKCDWLKAEDNDVCGDRIANIYGALYHFPINDCIVVDIGTEIVFDYVTKEGRCIGGMIYPGTHFYVASEIKIIKPESVMAKTKQAQIQSGVYFGILGAIERIVAELKMTQESPSSVMTLATGSLTEQKEFNTDLLDFIDCVDPHLTLVGLNQILTERK